MNSFEQGDSVRIEITIKKRELRVYTLYSVATGVTITITDPDHTAVITDAAMGVEGTGLYYYNYQSSSTSARGVYTIRVTATDGGTIAVIEEEAFKLK